MSEIVSVWNDAQLRAATPPPPYSLLNMNSCSLKITNDSPYTIDIAKNGVGVTIERIKPNSFVVLPAGMNQDLQLVVNTNYPISNIKPDHMSVEYTTMQGAVAYQTWSTQFNGATQVNINGTVDANITGTVDANITGPVNANIQNAEVNVQNAVGSYDTPIWINYTSGADATTDLIANAGGYITHLHLSVNNYGTSDTNTYVIRIGSNAIHQGTLHPGDTDNIDIDFSSNGIANNGLYAYCHNLNHATDGYGPLISIVGFITTSTLTPRPIVGTVQ